MSVPLHVHAGDALSRRELTALRSVATGNTLARVATGMGISEHTVKNHMVNIHAKLDVSTTIEAVALMDDYRPGWRPRLPLPARPVDSPARVRGGLARKGTDPGGRVEDIPEPFVTERSEET